MLGLLICFLGAFLSVGVGGRGIGGVAFAFMALRMRRACGGVQHRSAYMHLHIGLIAITLVGIHPFHGKVHPIS